MMTRVNDTDECRVPEKVNVTVLACQLRCTLIYKNNQIEISEGKHGVKGCKAERKKEITSNGECVHG